MRKQTKRKVVENELNKPKQIPKSKRGFTLIEMLATLTIMVILLGLSSQLTIAKTRQRAIENMMQDVKMIQAAGFNRQQTFSQEIDSKKTPMIVTDKLSLKSYSIYKSVGKIDNRDKKNQKISYNYIPVPKQDTETGNKTDVSEILLKRVQYMAKKFPALDGTTFTDGDLQLLDIDANLLVGAALNNPISDYKVEPISGTILYKKAYKSSSGYYTSGNLRTITFKTGTNNIKTGVVANLWN